MGRGIELIDNGPATPSAVRVLLDDGTEEMVDAVDYVMSGFKPPLCDLPVSYSKPQSADSFKLTPPRRSSL